MELVASRIKLDAIYEYNSETGITLIKGVISEKFKNDKQSTSTVPANSIIAPVIPIAPSVYSVPPPPPQLPMLPANIPHIVNPSSDLAILGNTLVSLAGTAAVSPAKKQPIYFTTSQILRNTANTEDAITIGGELPDIVTQTRRSPRNKHRPQIKAS